MGHGSHGAHGASRNRLLLGMLHGFNEVVLARELLDIAARLHPFKHWIALNLVDGHAIVLRGMSALYNSLGVCSANATHLCNTV